MYRDEKRIVTATMGTMAETQPVILTAMARLL